MDGKRLSDAVEALKQGKQERARKLILAQLDKNPRDLQAWIWAVEVAANDRERRTILKRILDLDPGHHAARKLLDDMDAATPGEEAQAAAEEASGPDPAEIHARRQEPHWIINLLLAPLNLFSALPGSWRVLLLVAAAFLGLFAFVRGNTRFMGLSGVDFDQLQVANAYQDVSLEDDYWKVRYEKGKQSVYVGTVRFVGPIRSGDYRLLTHDVLVTSGEFSDPEQVHTSVFNHKFHWQTDGPDQPRGNINLLHTVPSSEAIHQQLRHIQKWDQVRITGWEISTIHAFDERGEEKGYWADAGCNTLLVDSVTILPVEEAHNQNPGETTPIKQPQR